MEVTVKAERSANKRERREVGGNTGVRYIYVAELRTDHEFRVGLYSCLLGRAQDIYNT